MREKTCYFVERLTFVGWFLGVFPRMLKEKVGQVYVLEAPPSVMKTARKMASLFGASLEQFQFRSMDIRDKEGLLIRLRIYWKDLMELQKKMIVNSPLLHLVIQDHPATDRFASFFKKRMTSAPFLSTSSLGRALFLVHASLWKMRNLGEGTKGVLWLFKRMGMKTILEYSVDPALKIAILPSAGFFRYKHPYLVYLYHVVFNGIWFFKYPTWSRNSEILPQKAKVGLECYGHFNLHDASQFSDFFFCRNSALSESDLTVLFGIPIDPVDDKRSEMLATHQIQPVALSFKTTRTSRCKPFQPPFPQWNKLDLHGRKGSDDVLPFLKRAHRDYKTGCQRWKKVFAENNIKVFLSWYKFDERHCMLADAIKESGGILAVYQRALDMTVCVESLLDTHVAFGYSKFIAELDKKQDSKIPYFVITGYLGDHRFPLLKQKAETVRKQLQQKGAQHILSYTDEDVEYNSRWESGSDVFRENYQFLLEKILHEPQWGLVIKPKYPKKLRHRLGAVAPLLDDAAKTGRCFIYEEGHAQMQSYYPPAVAALSADIAVHGHLFGPSAAFESALAGVPTLLLDREGWEISPLYELGVGKVVFKNWNDLWQGCHEVFKHGKKSGLGDWEPMLDRLDPFRDGQAAKRMGNYVKWLIEGFRDELDREKVMANAAERYCKQWGYDKVVSV